jgi:hypothetical protein
VTPYVCSELIVPDEETHALQVPYDITKSQGLVYDLTSFLRVFLSNCNLSNVFFFGIVYLEHHLFLQSHFPSLMKFFEVFS